MSLSGIFRILHKMCGNDQCISELIHIQFKNHNVFLLFYEFLGWEPGRRYRPLDIGILDPQKLTNKEHCDSSKPGNSDEVSVFIFMLLLS